MRLPLVHRNSSVLTTPAQRAVAQLARVGSVTRVDARQAFLDLHALERTAEIRELPEAHNITHTTVLHFDETGADAALISSAAVSVSVTDTPHYTHAAVTRTVELTSGERVAVSDKRIWSGLDPSCEEVSRVEREWRLDVPQNPQESARVETIVRALTDSLRRVQKIVSAGTYGAFEEVNRFRRMKSAATYSAMIVPEGEAFVYYRGTFAVPFSLDLSAEFSGLPVELLGDILHEDFFIVYIPLKEASELPSSNDDDAQITIIFREGRFEEFSLREIRHGGAEPVLMPDGRSGNTFLLSLDGN